MTKTTNKPYEERKRMMKNGKTSYEEEYRRIMEGGSRTYEASKIVEGPSAFDSKESPDAKPVDKSYYEAEKKRLGDEKKEAWKDHLWNIAKDVATGAYSIVNTNDETLALAKASDEARKQSKEVKDSYSKKLADLDIARNEYNVAQATEQLNNASVNDRVAELYREKLLMEGQTSVGNQQMAQQATSMYGQKYKELKDEGYDVEQLLDVYGRQANEKTAAEMDRATQEFVKDSPGKAVLANVGSVLLNAASGSGILGAIESKTKELVTGEPSPIDTNSKYFVASNLRDTIRDTTDEEIQKNIDNDTLKGIASFAYRTGMNVGDALSTSWMPAPASLAIMATNAGTSATKQVVENGGTTSQALLTGLAAGGAEVLFDKLSLDNFSALKSTKGTGFVNNAVNMLKKTGVEGSEEFFTGIANRVSDDLINGGMSQYNLSVEQYKADGMSDDEAKSQANKDYMEQLATSFAQSALSSGITGTFDSAMDSAKNIRQSKNVGKNIQSTNNVQSTVDKGLSADPDSKVFRLASEMAGKMQNGENLFPYSIGNLHNKMTGENLNGKIEPAVHDRLAKLNVNDENSALSNAIIKKLSGEKVSMADNEILQNSKEAKRIISEYENSYNDQFTNDWVNDLTESNSIVTDNTPKSNYKRLYEAKSKGDMKAYDQIYRNLKQSGKSDKYIASGLRSAMTEYDGMVIEAAKKKAMNDFEGYSKIAKKVKAYGYSYNDFAKDTNSVFGKIRKGKSTKKVH